MDLKKINKKINILETNPMKSIIIFNVTSDLHHIFLLLLDRPVTTGGSHHNWCFPGGENKGNKQSIHVCKHKAILILSPFMPFSKHFNTRATTTEYSMQHAHFSEAAAKKIITMNLKLQNVTIIPLLVQLCARKNPLGIAFVPVYFLRY